MIDDEQESSVCSQTAMNQTWQDVMILAELDESNIVVLWINIARGQAKYDDCIVAGEF